MRMLTEAEYRALIGNVSAINSEGDLRAVLGQVLARAAELKLVVTVEQRSLTPLAMGNYETVVAVREARG